MSHKRMEKKTGGNPFSLLGDIFLKSILLSVLAFEWTPARAARKNKPRANRTESLVRQNVLKRGDQKGDYE